MIIAGLYLIAFAVKLVLAALIVMFAIGGAAWFLLNPKDRASVSNAWMRDYARWSIALVLIAAAVTYAETWLPQ